MGALQMRPYQQAAREAIHGRIVDVAFASEVTVGGKSCIYLQTHRLVLRDGRQQYQITNEYFTSENEDTENADYKPAPLPAGVLKSFTTGSSVPWFSVFSPNIVKNLPGGPGLGMSVFSEALDQSKHCDLAFDNYCRDADVCCRNQTHRCSSR